MEPAVVESIILGAGVVAILLVGFVVSIFCIASSGSRRIGGSYSAGTPTLDSGEAFRIITRSRRGSRPDEALSRELQRRQLALESRRGAGRG